MRRTTAGFLSLVATVASAGILDDLPDLQGKVVAYAGEFEQVTCPIGGQYDCLTWPSDLFKTTRGRDICFKPTGYTRCTYSCKGLIALGDDKTPFLYIIENIGGDMKKSPIEIYKCPAPY